MVDQIFKIRIKYGEAEIEVEGDKEFVEKHIEEFKKAKLETVVDWTKKKSDISENLKDEPELEKVSLVEFYKMKNPKDHNETVVVFAYWLTNKEGLGEFQEKDIGDCYDKVRIQKPTVIRQHIRAMASGKKAFLTTGSKRGYYKLTLTGEEFVQKNLDSDKDNISKPVDVLTEEVKTPNGSKQSAVPKQSKSSSVDNVPPEEFDIRGNETAPSFREFLEEKKPSKSAADIIAVTGFYFKQHLNKEDFSEGNVMYAYGIAGAKRPKKVHQAFHDTKTRKQWIKQGSASDKWILTHIGEDYVLHDLPKK